MKKKYYLTTAIPYVNGKPHIGHALEYFIADTIHRYYELAGRDVFFVSGADENAIKNIQAAEKEGLNPQEFLDRNSKVFEDFYELLDVKLDVFRRGTDQKLHWPGVQKLWKLAADNGDIYKKKYKGLYCVGCASFKTNKELVDGKCPDHNKAPELVEEENYFFKLSKYQDKLIELIASDKFKIRPTKRKNEVLAFIRRGLEDFSISRSNERSKGVGVPVPGDDTQKIYVWFDALTIYMTAIGYGLDENNWKKYWPANLHVIGKDIIRFHTVYWPAMLLSASLPLPKSILAHGFITSGGVKMSKSIGNVIDPYKTIEKYGLEPTRYFLLSQIPTQDDGDITFEKFEHIYQSDLANGLGNLAARVAGLAEKSKLSFKAEKLNINQDVARLIEDYKIDKALDVIWETIKETDMFISNNKVWELSGEESKKALTEIVHNVRHIAVNLKPFLPETAAKIEKQFKNSKIKSGKPLFPRLPTGRPD